MKAKLTTYTLPRPFQGYNIPVAIQSAYMRDYAARSGYQFSLPVTELTTSNSYLMLMKIVRAEYDEPLNLAACSGFVFPVENPDLLHSIFFDKEASEDLSIHLVLEAKIVDRQGLMDWAHGLRRIRNLVRSYNDQDLRLFKQSI